MWRRGQGKVFRLVDPDGTVVAGSWDKPPDNYALTLADLAKVLEGVLHLERSAKVLEVSST